MSIREATVDDVWSIRNIAEITWPVAYGQILSKAQLDYMLDMMYATDIISNSISSASSVFLIAEDHHNNPIGFAGYRKDYKESGRYRLDKLYVLPDQQGKGIGKKLIAEILNDMSNAKAKVLELNVNRNNNAKLFYEKLGFEIIHTEDIDIGNGYFMNDYVMELRII